LSTIEVTPARDLAEPLSLLEASLRDGEPVPEAFAGRLRKSVETGDIDVLAARSEDQILGVAVLAYRPNIPAGALFASIEDLYVRPEARRQGVGTALLATANERCAARKISYVEVQVEDEAAESFYKTLGYESEGNVRVLSRSLPIEDRNDKLRADR
jgi:ribosomal protein S18 acetylase RimI-like enzyme